VEPAIAEVVIRPTRKWVSYSYTTTIIAVCVLVFAYNNYMPEAPKWPLGVAAALLLWPISLDVRQRFTKIVLGADKLRYETGILSKTTRTIPLSKVQDVRVDQKLCQRLFGVGDLSIESAGESSRLTIRDIDRPQTVADELIDMAQSATPKKKGERG
jgi:uncharacterized membrane protein YdbT with pleckstrin-like domain